MGQHLSKHKTTKKARRLTRMAPLARPMPTGDILGPCGWPGARGHHVGEPAV